MFLDSLQLLLVSRFLINLRQVDAHLGAPDRSLSSESSGLRFERGIADSIVGNMGETLEHGAPGDFEEDSTDDEAWTRSASPAPSAQTDGQERPAGKEMTAFV